MTVAWKNLVFERFRFVAALIGAGFAVLLVLIMVGVYVGTTSQVTTYINHTAGKVWVMQPGVNQMFRAVSSMPDTVGDQVSAVDGVADSAPVLGVPSSFLRNGSQTAYYLLGFDPEDADVAGPWNISEGRAAIGHGETVLDRVLATKNGINVGDTVNMIGKDFIVVGLSNETAAVGNFYAFITLDDARQVMQSPDRVSYFILTPTDGVSASALADRVHSEVKAVEAMTSAEFAENSKQIVISMIGRPLKVMIAIGVLVGAAVIALTVLSLSSEQRRDFGVMKAIGARDRTLYRLVVTQAGLLALGGYVIGGLVAYAAQFGIKERLGDVTVEITPAMLASMFAVTVLMAVAGSVVPVRRVAAVDPAEAFRA
jgi:putative ABC transport system permease protein